MTKMFSLVVLIAMGLGTGQVRIDVQPMGTDHEAMYFQKLLTDHLARSGYQPKQPLVLVTTLSTPVVGGETRAYATAEVRAADGREVWSDEFPKSDGWRQARGRDALRKLAEEIVSAVVRQPSP